MTAAMVAGQILHFKGVWAGGDTITQLRVVTAMIDAKV
jgi:hypothetical protein